MIMNSQLVAILARIYAASANIEAMRALNQRRISFGEALAYDDNDFFAVQVELERLADRAAAMVA